MPLGPFVRRLFGRHENRIAELYRAVFIDLDAYSELIGSWAPHAQCILEVGCGEGAVTEHLAQLYPDATILAIDITPSVGRLYRGPTRHVNFRQATVQTIASETPARFDLIVLSDVIHHVPIDQRDAIFTAIRTCIAPNGLFLFKDWKRSATPIHWLCYGGDRWLTGDRISYLNLHEARTMLEKAFGSAPQAEAFIRPWRNNFAMLVQA